MIRNQILKQNFLKLTNFQRRCSNRTIKPTNGPVAEKTVAQEDCQEESNETFKVRTCNI